ncbi:conserved oligomeric Golgi complex subunit 7-like [Gigantopelta aegis]|uniref:conserved oligomeric Golgi complex subunit 7-like n=1 Tax=Gigantopelta aegis TaxID=1735272 RepID=UPI001B88828F|nr:conserved oligomeric Golgi complex subunit 7-like [Gigantopelta aegis]
MDYSKFMDDNFDAKEWVNSAFQSQPDPNIPKDQYATTLVMKLQMFIQEVNNVLEEAGQQALQNLPRVVREVEAVRQEGALLQDQMRTVKQDIQNVEQNTAQSMQVLLKLDGIKSRMKTTADALTEADNWTTLSADMEEVFQSQDVHAITDKLSRMQQSLQMLVDTPDYGEKCQHLEKLKNRLEALLSPQLVKAFNSQSLESAQMYMRIFETIDRLPQLYKYYHKCHKGQLLQAWRDILEMKQDNNPVECIVDFYDHLSSTWHTQIKWCMHVFDDSVPIVCDLLSESLTSLDPSFSSCFTRLLQQRESTLDALIELKQISERFARSMENAVELQMEDNLKHEQCLEKLLRMILAPYRPYLQKYQTFEEVALDRDLNNIPLDHMEVMDTVQLLGESVNKLFNAANQANERCQKLTNGFCYEGLLAAIKTYFTNYCHEFHRVLGNIREKCRTSHVTDSEDWSNFQHSLRIIQTCGDLITHTEQLDELLISSILHSVGKYLGSSSPTKDTVKKCSLRRSTLQFQASLFLDDESAIAALETMVTSLEEGDTPSVLTDVKAQMSRLSEEVHKFGFDIVFAQLQKYLSNLSNMEIWTSHSAGGAMTSDLPTFSISPQEYITKIGQYLMTLPQHLDPFTLQDSSSLTVALKHGKLLYTDEQEMSEHLADLWLESVAKGTMHMFSEEIIKIHQLTPHATKQLITDIDYLNNVLDDLGIQISDTLRNIDTLLQAKPEEFTDIAESAPQRIAHAIAAMREIEL